MSIALMIFQIAVTAVYGVLCAFCPAYTADICGRCFRLLLVNLLCAGLVSSGCFAAAKPEAYDLIEGYDRNKVYNENVLKMYFKKLTLNVQTVLLLCSLAAFAAPLLSGSDRAGDHVILYAHATGICMLMTMIVTARRHKI